ncbi:HNH endonuclease [Candidatus Poriferisocius sp.]|uniref:HNH endonuclease n=1 Tax=Candidatus Poriferisocius sp. TaxID=3101276 RepID=UPI003B5942FE
MEWQHGGPTQQDNLVLLCHPCHHRDWTVEHHPDTNRPYLKPPWQQPPEPPQRR